MIDIVMTDLSSDDQDEEKKTDGIRYADVDNVAKVDEVAQVLLHPQSLGMIKHGMTKHFYSDGSFNLIQLCVYILKQTGPAHVFLTSYSISEDSLQVLRRKVDNGDIIDIRYIIDNRVKSMSPKPFDLLSRSFPGCYKCRAIHAKVALIYNDDWKITVIGSQNATRNPKLERGIIHTDDHVFNFDLKILEDEFIRGTT